METLRVYGLVGYPLGHSFSARYFNSKFEREGIDAVYRNFAIEDIGQLGRLIEDNPRLTGLNVTIPYKERVQPFMTWIDESALEIGAINVVKIERDGDRPRLYGYNTDSTGFTRSIEPLLTRDMKRGLVLGTGGASKAVAHGLGQLGIEVNFVSRRPGGGNLTYEELDEKVMKEHLVIVNATPSGTYPNVETCPAIPYSYLTARHLCYDLVYNPEETLFMKRSKEFGARTKNGLEMLQIQADEAWKIWNR